ncbi:hypothetical protein ACFL04_01125 [Patescibacteria group bacterium]
MIKKMDIEYTVTGQSQLIRSIYGNIVFFIARFVLQDLLGLAPTICGKVNENCRQGCHIALEGNFDKPTRRQIRQLLYARLNGLADVFGSSLSDYLDPLTIEVISKPTSDGKDPHHASQ